MAEIFDVQYNIDVFSSSAVQGINRFVNAANKLSEVSTKLQNFQATFRNIETMSTKGFALNIKTDVALKRLERVYNKLGQIKNTAAKINLGVQGGTAGAGGKGGKTTTPRTAMVPTPTTTPRQGSRPQRVVTPAGSRARTPLIPNNLEYQVLGPTRLGNVAMLDMFKGMGIMYGISAIGSGVRDIITTSAEYQNVMQTARNILKTNYKGNNFNASFANMERIARDVAVETSFTAPEVADAVKFLAMAGLDINAISKSIRPIADIAMIGDNDLGTTADVMTNIMTAYGIKPEDMRKTADVMTRTFTMSNTTLMELAESFKMAGSMLHLANVPFETAAAAFGVLGDAGIKATMAGTTMRTIMNNLRNPTKGQRAYWDMLGVRRYDEYGNLRQINEIFADLNALNGNDERSAEARKRYDELQKKYAPKFEGLTEGSAQYNNVLAQYDQESEAIRRQFGGVDVFRLFRLTAASGAGVLMSHVEKWNQIIEENFMSQGLSEKLANEKMKQIVNVWKRLKSAFQEQGLKVFEENDGALRNYLEQGISWLKSDHFSNVLRGVIDLVASLGKTLIEFTGHIVKLYEKFAPLVKLYLQFQLYAKGIQTVLIAIKGLGNSFLYLMSGLFSGFGRGAAGMGMRGAVGAAPLYGGWYGGMIYNNPFFRLMGPGYASLLETGDPWLAAKADPRWVGGSKLNKQTFQNNYPIFRRYDRANTRINAMNRYSGVGMMGGALLGGVIGNNFDEDKGMMWGSAIGMGLGALAPLLVGSGPWGWAIGGAVVAITGITSAIVKYQREMARAKQETESYIASLRTLNIGKIDLSSADAIFNANIRITTSLLHTENEKLELQAELWKRIREEREGIQETYDKNTGRDVIQQIKDYRNKYWYSDYWTSKSKEDAFALARKKLLQELNNAGIVSPVNTRDYQITDSNGNTVTYTGPNYDKTWDKEFINSFAALSAAFNPENPYVNMARNSLQSKMFALKSVKDYDETIAKFWNDFGFSIDQNKKINKLKDSDFDALLSDNGLLEYPEYGIPIMKQLESIANGFEAQRKLLELIDGGFDLEANNLVLPMANTQKVLNTFIGELFDPSRFGQFGTYDWLNKVRDYANSTKMGVDQFGNIVEVPNFAGGLEGEEFNRHIQAVYNEFLDFFNKLPETIRPFYYPYLDKSYWESLGGSVNLNEFNGLTPDLQSKYGALKVTPAPFLSPLMYQNDTLTGNGLDRPLYYPNSLALSNSVNDALALPNRGAVAQRNVTVNVYFDKAINVENVNEADWGSEDNKQFMAQVVIDTITEACNQISLPNELSV